MTDDITSPYMYALNADPDKPMREAQAQIAHLTDENELLRSIVTDCRIEIARLTAERDEARESYCSLMEAYRGGDGKATAEKMGWQYLFKEDGK